jgi:hypothetical protein
MEHFERGNWNTTTTKLFTSMQKLDDLKNEQAMVSDYFLQYLYKYINRIGVEQFDGSHEYVWGVQKWLSFIYKLSQIQFLGSLGADDCWILRANKRPYLSVYVYLGFLET